MARPEEIAQVGPNSEASEEATNQRSQRMEEELKVQSQQSAGGMDILEMLVRKALLHCYCYCYCHI